MTHTTLSTRNLARRATMRICSEKTFRFKVPVVEVEAPYGVPPDVKIILDFLDTTTYVRASFAGGSQPGILIWEEL